MAVLVSNRQTQPVIGFGVFGTSTSPMVNRQFSDDHADVVKCVVLVILGFQREIALRSSLKIFAICLVVDAQAL